MATRKVAACILFIGLMSLCMDTVSCRVRKYYIAAQDIKWDYADSTTNLVNTDQQGYADAYLGKPSDRIGRTYWKVSYFQYTDDTFTTEIPKPAYFGIMGPLIRAEVNDVIEVVYLNNASGTYSLHPHGVFYLKQHEGALYQDGTSGQLKSDDLVGQGKKVTLRWNVTDVDSPSKSDPNCIPWSYHSHVRTVPDTSTGVLGTLVTCKKGILDDNNERTDVKVDIPILMKIFDENLSWNLEKNIEEFCTDVAACNNLKDDENEDFIESNYMHSLNGKSFGHLKGLEVCVNEKVAFYILGMGNEFDVHSLHFAGQNMHYQHTRGDTISVFTATFVAAETIPRAVGKWIMSDMVDGMARSGMSAFLVTKDCGAASSQSINEKTADRSYFLMAEAEEWDYGPGGKDKYLGISLTDTNGRSAYFFDKSDPSHIGGKYIKGRFFGYTDANYNKRTTQETHMGILGPVIYAEVGEVISVKLKNKLSKGISFLPHGVTFDFKEHLGNVYNSTYGSTGILETGKSFEYKFMVPKNLLDDSDGQCESFLYTSGASPTRDHNTGLVGPILICKKGYNGLEQTDVKNFFILVSMFDENESMYIGENIKKYSSGTADVTNPDFKTANQIFTLNGYAFGTIPGLTMCYNQDVTWYALSVGMNTDVHSLGFDGNTFTTDGKHRNVQKLVSGSNAALHMTPDNEGNWLIESETSLPLNGGAYGLYDVNRCSKPIPRDTFTKERKYYIAADEVDWNFAPIKKSIIDGADITNVETDGNIFIRDTKDFIGDVYRKAVFREYTDSTFKNAKIRTNAEAHMDILGPVIRAEVGEKITVVFKNKATRGFSMHPQGLKYNQANAGKTYNQDKADIQPGATRTYTWYVPARSGPGPSDPECIPWIYYSATDQVKDIISGLVGPILVCKPGILDDQGKRKDKQQEFFLTMLIFDENKSWYLTKNVEDHAPSRVGTDYLSDADFEESNKMHSINGRIFGNNHDMKLDYNTTVHWYFLVMGSELDLHSIHTHGHTFLHPSNDHREDVLSLFPGMAETVTMRTINPGTWLLHCHVLDHISAGMQATYTVLEPEHPGGKAASITVGYFPIMIALQVILCKVFLNE